MISKNDKRFKEFYENHGTTVYIDMNLVPLCVIWGTEDKKRVAGQDSIIFSGRLYLTKNNPLIYNYQVFWNSDYAPPNTFDLEVWRAIEHCIHIEWQWEKLKQKNIGIPYRDIIKQLGISQTGGHLRNKVYKSVEKLSNVCIRRSLSQIINEKEVSTTSFVFLLDHYKVITIKDRGRSLKGVSFNIPNKIYQSYMNNEIFLLNKTFRDSLRRPLARRLYEILAYKFFIVLKKQRKSFYRVSYKYLCDLMGCKARKYLSAAMEGLDPSIQALQDAEFIESYEWKPITKSGQKIREDWIIKFRIGRKAKEEAEYAFTFSQAPSDFQKSYLEEPVDDAPFYGVLPLPEIEKLFPNL